jgi:hypothetical protein
MCQLVHNLEREIAKLPIEPFRGIAFVNRQSVVYVLRKLTRCAGHRPETVCVTPAGAIVIQCKTCGWGEIIPKDGSK